MIARRSPAAKVGFVSLPLVAGIFGIFAWSRLHGATIEEARTYAVNTLVVMEIFCLFSVDYLRAPSLTFKACSARDRS